ncbi:unnamed protein product [Tilletia laevis]|uniref:Uncharacterized protein n=1 Tax=Tilletia laevis TaxID=157183 RepID=A0A9N8M4L9_9BASI|nr:unnamed protein product [Tilletia laevis]CAD6983518.1 unnamed protein product [Tilletia controversa]
MATSFVLNSVPDASEILAMAIQTLIQLAPKTSPSQAVVECAQILKAAQESPFESKIPEIGNTATANKIQVLSLNAGKANCIFSEMVAVIAKASRDFGTFCDEYAEVTEGLQRQGSGTAGLQLYLELEIVDSRAVRPTAVLTTATATATVPGPTSLLPAVTSALAGSSVAGVRVPVTSGLGGVSASLPLASISGSVPLGDVSGILSTGLPSISIPRGLTSSKNASFHGSKASYDGDAHVRIPVQPTAEEASTISDDDDDDDDDDQSRDSYPSSDSIGDIPDESTDSSIISDEWSPCWHAAGIDVSPPRRYRYRGLLPTVIGRYFPPMKIVAPTTSAIPVQVTNPAGGSRGLESFPSFVIGEIQPRPASKNKVPRFKVVEPIVAPSCPHRQHKALDQSPSQRLQVLCQVELNPCAENPRPLKAPGDASTKRRLLFFGSRHQQHRSCSTTSSLQRTLAPSTSSSFAVALDSILRSPRYLPLRNAPCPRRLALD